MTLLRPIRDTWSTSVGVARERDFGGELLKLIREHCGEAGVEADLAPPVVKKAEPPGIWKPSGPAERAFPMIAKGMSLEEIATQYASITLNEVNRYLERRTLGEVTIVVGASDVVASGPDEAVLDARIDEALARGERAKLVAETLAVAFVLPRREVYARVLERKRVRGE